MFLLYVDDSGSVGNRKEKHFILGGVCLFERQVYWLSKELDRIVESVKPPEFTDLELHASQILSGSGSWRKLRLTQDQRRAVVLDSLDAGKIIRGPCRLFGVVVDKLAISPRSPIEYAFEQICSRFDHYLRRLKFGDPPQTQRGLIIFDKSSKESRFQSLATQFRTGGHTWGRLTNQVDVPLFVDSKATRAIQYADLVTHALWRKYEKGDDAFFNKIKNNFDREGHVVHGLHHYKSTQDSCSCPACPNG